MISDRYVKMMSEIGAQSLMIGKDDYSDEVEMLMREQQQQRRQQEATDKENELDIYRSGSAPPTVEGSMSGLMGVHGVGRSSLSEVVRSDPKYIKYYYSHVNMNPRLPPPLFSREDLRFAQNLQGGGSGSGSGSGSSVVVGNRSHWNGASADEEEGGDRSLFSVQPQFSGKNLEKEMEAPKEWSGDGLIGLQEVGIGQRQKSFIEIIQGNNSGHATNVSGHLSRPPSGHAFDNDNVLHPNRSSLDSNLASQTYASALGASLSRSTTPNVGGALGRSLNEGNIDVLKSSDDFSQDIDVHGDLMSALSRLNLSEEGNNPNTQIHYQNMYRNDHNPLEMCSLLNKNESMQFHNSSLPYSGSYLNRPHTPLLNTGSNSPSQYPNFDSPNGSFSTFDLGASVMNPSSPSMSANPIGYNNMLPMLENNPLGPDTRGQGGRFNSRPNLLAAPAELQNLRRVGNQNLGSDMLVSTMDPLYLHYLRSMGNSSMEMLELQNLESLLLHQNSQYSHPYVNKTCGLNNGYYRNTENSLGSPLMGSLLPNSPIGSSTSIWRGDRNIGFSPGMTNLAGNVMGTWHLEHGMSLDECFSMSLLDQFKSCKTKCFELSEIAGHVVEFSADQYGSRFIQQKLETASIEEKDMIFIEIMPHALSLMTDVFGNYVIQKFLEQGSSSQIREVADQLIGHVLELSLQMYGCRVIQKAFEVVDLDQKIKMVKELENNVLCCVKDQNGNHVIQKCIECIPEDAIQFIISTFYDQVVTYSTHAYGCRVIQRILEHCRDPRTQSIVMDEILQSVCKLAQDQYGNYVVQHVLEHGKPHERSFIISKFIGQIVLMSQQKFASNVVEKCLIFGSPEERHALVNEMLGSTDDNEPLQEMMKDQFANYVVQKVLETCDDQQLELILNRIKAHLNTLNKYTYGKHIVTRIEKLVATGERRIGILALQVAQRS